MGTPVGWSAHRQAKSRIWGERPETEVYRRGDGPASGEECGDLATAQPVPMETGIGNTKRVKMPGNVQILTAKSGNSPRQGGPDGTHAGMTRGV